MTLLLLLAGCPKPVTEVPPALVSDPAAAAAAAQAAGRVEGGVWVDAVYPFSVRIPEGWAVVPGSGGDVRFRTSDTTGEIDVEVRAVPGGPREPLPRAGCTWDFVDTARYRELRLPAPLTVATCSPIEADGERVLGWYFGETDVTYTVEAAIAPGSLDRALGTLGEMLGTVRMR